MPVLKNKHGKYDSLLADLLSKPTKSLSLRVRNSNIRNAVSILRAGLKTSIIAFNKSANEVGISPVTESLAIHIIDKPTPTEPGLLKVYLLNEEKFQLIQD